MLGSVDAFVKTKTYSFQVDIAAAAAAADNCSQNVAYSSIRQDLSEEGSRSSS